MTGSTLRFDRQKSRLRSSLSYDATSRRGPDGGISATLHQAEVGDQGAKNGGLELGIKD